MTDKVQKIREEVVRLISQKDEKKYSGIILILELKKVLSFIDSMQKEPIDYNKLNTMLDESLSKETKESWNEWLGEEPASDDEIEKQFKVGDIVVYMSRHPAYSGLYLLGNPNDLSIGYSNANEPYQIALRNCTVASEDERRQFMRELNDNGYKWNEDTLRIDKKEKPVSEEWIEELRTKLASLSKEDFKKVFDKYTIDFNEEPVSEDLEKAYTEYANERLKLVRQDISDSSYSRDRKMSMDIFDGYQIEDAFEAGANWQREQMMKDAIDGEVLENYDGKVLEYDDSILDEKLSNCNVFDKVKIIVIKED